LVDTRFDSKKCLREGISNWAKERLNVVEHDARQKGFLNKFEEFYTSN
jgi:hypothetical protein